MSRFRFFIFVVFLATAVVAKSNTKLHQWAGLNIFELAAAHDYPLELHEVTTEDGYILGVHRIPYGKTNLNESGKPVVFIMHGLLGCSADWINIGPEKSLAYKLVELGYDVWLGNARGNAESKKHISYDPVKDKKKFWNFSWNEIGTYDLPAMIDFILDYTKNEQLQYVGYSQGTTVFLAMASNRPEYNAKIKFATLLAPSAAITHTKHPFKGLASLEPVISGLTDFFGFWEFFPRTKLLYEISKAFCDAGKETQELCKIILYLIAGYDPEQLDGNFIPVIATNTPAGANIKQVAHFLQIVNGKEFRKYDYHNEQLNMEIYGSKIPPNYILENVIAPVALYYSENDILASDIDAINLSRVLPNVKYSKLLEYKAFTHLDFMWAIDVDTLLYNNVIEVIQENNL